MNLTRPARGSPDFPVEKFGALTLASASQSCLPLRNVARGQPLFRKSRKPLNKKTSEVFRRVSNWVQGLDLNQATFRL